ncbi:polysaccharide biosynthesis C-terminal domain-containing protein [Patescibacteria group bacterium]|nr:polysaccharide biosynthesis C-terminal domain-containing protein [Patescibacteria group bacterium]
MLRKTIQSTGVQIAGKAVTTLISLETIRLLTGTLGVKGYGNFTLITSIFLLFDAAADLGTRVIGVREMVQAGKEKQQKIWVQLFELRLFLAAVMFGVGTIFSLVYSGFEGIRGEAMAALLMLWGTSVAGSLEILWQYRLKLEVKTIIDVLFPLLFVVWLLMNASSFNLLQVMVAYLVARWISVAVGWLTVKDFFKGIKISWDSHLLKKLLRESWPMGLYLLLFTGYDKAVDSMLIRHYWGVEPVAWYGLAYKIYSNLIMPAYFFMASVFPLLSQDKDQGQIYRKSRWLVLGMILLGAPLVYMLAPWAIDILSHGQYQASVGVLRVLIVALFFSYLNHLNGFWLISRGKQKLMLIFGITVLITNVVGNVLLIPIYGILAGAWMTVASEGLMWALTSWKIGF